MYLLIIKNNCLLKLQSLKRFFLLKWIYTNYTKRQQLINDFKSKVLLFVIRRDCCQRFIDQFQMSSSNWLLAWTLTKYGKLDSEKRQYHFNLSTDGGIKFSFFEPVVSTRPNFIFDSQENHFHLWSDISKTLWGRNLGGAKHVKFKSFWFDGQVLKVENRFDISSKAIIFNFQ